MIVRKADLPPDMNTSVKCEVCGWSGLLHNCTEKETYHVTNTNHHYMCPNCGSDVYNWVEDKHLGITDECEAGKDPASPACRTLGENPEEDDV